MENNHKAALIRFPAREVALDTYECPCGRTGLHRYKNYLTGLDDADPDWGSYDESYGFSTDDPCFRKYSVVRLDEANKEFILQITE